MVWRRDGPAEVRQIDAGKDAAMEAEVKAARERAVVPQEVRVQHFMEMLAEKEVWTDFLLIICTHCAKFF